MKVVPAILAADYDAFLLRLRQAESFTDYIQIDLMDGIFVPSRSFAGEKLNTLETSIEFEVHLMVKHPATYMSRIGNPRLKKVIFHCESDVKYLEFIAQMKEREIDIGLAVNPETKIEEFKTIAENVNTLMFLTVDPCCYGNPFKPQVMEKIRKARHMFEGKILSVDGGVSLENLRLFVEAGIDYVCVGSRIFLNGDPRANYGKFISGLNELEGKR